MIEPAAERIAAAVGVIVWGRGPLDSRFLPREVQAFGLHRERPELPARESEILPQVVVAIDLVGAAGGEVAKKEVAVALRNAAAGEAIHAPGGVATVLADHSRPRLVGVVLGDHV